MSDISVVYEDNHVLVVEKPQNVPSQADISGDEDMLSIIKLYVKEKYSKPGEVYLGLVHRLDRPAGGLMVFARTSKAASRLSAQMRAGGFDKEYLAVVRGEPEYGETALTDYLVKDGKSNIVGISDEHDDSAKKADLIYNTLTKSEGMALISINLLTGRSHQIRVQLANAGFPLYGDVKYGGNSAGNMTKKLALWSRKLSFIHPVSGSVMEFNSRPPDIHPWNIPVFAGVMDSLFDNFQEAK